MKETTVTRYEAFDGEMFDTAAECNRYERDNSWHQLIGLTEERVKAAISYEDPELVLADVFETVGLKIKALRLSKGHTKINRAPREANGEELPPPVGRQQPMTAEEAEQHTV
jgi:hypothetical protein